VGPPPPPGFAWSPSPVASPRERFADCGRCRKRD
jgi:hypothetical protein